MNKEKLNSLKTEYKDILINSVLDFWLKHSLDKKNGGYYTALDRKGSIIDTDKSVWFQGRGAWTFANIYADFEKDKKYLDASKLGIDFLENKCFDKNGKMFFRVTEDGREVIMRKRYIFSETFCLIAYANYARASNDKTYIEKARKVLASIEKYLTTPGMLEPKYNTQNRASIGFGVHMIMLATVQELRKADKENESYYNSYIDKCLADMFKFIKDDKKVVLEQLNPDGSIQEDHFEGRLLNPGHAIEGAWFVMHEGYYRKDKAIMDRGIKMLNYMWEWGWDKEHGGIIYFQDVLNKPKSEYWHDMKFWWPQNEAAIATLYAYFITGDEEYFKKHLMVYEYTKKFIDKEHGEWYGYLHRDGTLSTDLKGNMYKGPFHIPRMYMRCIELLDLILK